MSEKEEKLKSLKVVIDHLEKVHGKGAVMRLDSQVVEAVPSISTGSLGLDIVLGILGLPRGRVVEIYGPESSGKTTLTLHCIAEAQKQGGLAAFIDAEHAFDKGYAKALGIDTEGLFISQPDYGEQALDIAESLIRSSSIDVIVIDSVAALVPKVELDGEAGATQVALQARMMSQALRRLTGIIGRTKCVCIFINQLREKIGAYTYKNETTTGGNALKFYASVRLDIRKKSALKKGDDVIGNRVRVRVVKNKVSPPFRTAEFDILFGQGISKVGEVVDMATTLGIVQKSGSWYAYNKERLGQGRDNLISVLRDNPELQEEIERKVRAHVKERSTQP